MNEQPPPAWADKMAPESLRLLQTFVNTHQYTTYPDHLATITTAKQWLREQGFPAPRLDLAQLKRVTVLRETLREVLLAHAGHNTNPPLAQLHTQLKDATVQLTIDQDDTTKATARGKGVDHFINTLAAELLTASLNNTWTRLKACGNHECNVAFYDHSRNATTRYCTTSICANRVRQRTFRERLSGSTE
jgi:predicted RNA-binding Zn ribbon-like protein